MAEALADDIFRRRSPSGREWRGSTGREAAIAEVQAVADLGAKRRAMTVIAIRGQRLALIRSRFSNGDLRPEVFHIESLTIVEIDGDDRVAAHIMFDPDDLEAAFEELDARYLAGEAAAYADTWSVITGGYAALNRHELPPTTPDWVNIDHRRGSAFAPGELIAYVRAGWDLAPRHPDLRRGRASAERLRRSRHPRGARELARGLRRRVAGRSTSWRSKATWSAAAKSSTRQTSTPRSRDSNSSADRRRGSKTRQSRIRAHPDALSGA